ncbi:MAG: peptide ABC transporter substrate-binding protein [Chlamydiales bacterium]
MNSSKNSAIVSSIKTACSRFPRTFDLRLLKGFERITSNCCHDFIEERSLFHLYRLIFGQYFLQKKIENALYETTHPKHLLFFRLLYLESKACFLFTCSLEQATFISNQYLLKVLQNNIAGIHEVPHSSFRWIHPEFPYLMGYLEFQKIRGKKLTAKQVRLLEKTIKDGLISLSPVSTPAVFWPYNAEESYRRVLILQKEIKNENDLPHASIQFKGQSAFYLEFLIQLVTPITTFSLENAAQKLPSSVQLSHYNTSITDESDFSKKSFIFSLQLPHDLFFENGVVNLLHARRLVARYLEVLTGPFRDYNGGLLEKQSQQFDKIKSRLASKIASFTVFAETLFYSLRPIEMQFALSFEKVEALFSLFSQSFNQKGETTITDSSRWILVIKSLGFDYPASILQEINQLSVVYGECTLAQYHYFSLVAEGEIQFIKIKDLLQKKKKAESKVLRLNFREGPPISLSPHYLHDIRSRVLSKLLFEGLVRQGANGKVTLAGAEHVTKQNSLTYLFKIRPNFWSNGERVTAYHYEQAWKEALLSTDVSSELFLSLKGAKKVHELQKPLEEVGVQALNDFVLKVSLEYPDPYFFEKLLHPLFFPRYFAIQQEPECFNGPYILQKMEKKELALVTNPYFRKQSKLNFEKVVIKYMEDTDQILNAFNSGELHWVGEPFDYIPALSAFQSKKRKSIRPFCIYFNTQCAHFSSKWIRQALSKSIDRIFISNSILAEATPLYSPLPESNYLESKQLNTEELKALFNKGLQEIGLSSEQFPSINLMFYPSEDHTNLILYLKHRWENLFGITIQLQEMGWNQFCDCLDKREFQVCGFYESALTRDPLNFLSRFEKSTGALNFPSWEDPIYQKIVREAQKTIPLEKRNQLLKQAETILIDSMPVIPIANSLFIYSHHPNLTGFIIDYGGCVDFSQAYLENI